MKKLLLLLAATLLAAGIANAQFGNLGSRLVNKAVNKATDKAIDKATDKAVDKLFEEKDEATDKAEKSESDEPTVKSTLAEATTVKEVDWSSLDAIVLPPSSAPEVKLFFETERLYKQFPEIPSSAKMLSATEKEVDAYRKALDKIETELDDYSEGVEKKYEKVREEIATRQLMKTTGLTEEDIKRIEDPNTTEAEKEALRAKVYASVITSEQMQTLAEEQQRSDNAAVSATSVSSTILQREGLFMALALGEQRNCEAELLSVNTKRSMARSNSRIKELDAQIDARRNATARQLAERNIEEVEWRLHAQRVLLNETAVQNTELSKLYDKPSDRATMLEYSGIASQINYISNLLAIYRSVFDYTE